MALLSPSVYDHLQSFIYGDFSVAYTFFINQFRKGGLREGDRVIDIGCGTGLLSFRFTSNGIAYTGLDMDPKRIATAQIRNPAGEFLCGDLTTPEILKKVDLRFCIMHGVIHHLKDQEFENLKSILKSNGCRVLCSMDPLRPKGLSRPLATLACNLDDGKYVRYHADYKTLFGGLKVESYIHKYPRWPAEILYMAAHFN